MHIFDPLNLYLENNRIVLWFLNMIFSYMEGYSFSDCLIFLLIEWARHSPKGDQAIYSYITAHTLEQGYLGSVLRFFPLTTVGLLGTAFADPNWQSHFWIVEFGCCPLSRFDPKDSTASPYLIPKEFPLKRAPSGGDTQTSSLSSAWFLFLFN